MSTGFGYDMMLISIKGQGGVRVTPARSKVPRQPRHHASPPKKRRGQHRHHPSATSRSSTRARRAVVQEPTVPRAEATGTTAQRQDDHTTTLEDGVSRALSPSTALLPHDLFASKGDTPVWSRQCNDVARQGDMPGRPDVCGATIGPAVRRQDTAASLPADELPDFSRVRSLRRLGPGRYTITSLRQRLAEEGRGCFYAAEPDPDSESDSYDPTRECFNVDGEVATTDGTQDAVAGGRALVAREDPWTPGNDE